MTKKEQINLFRAAYVKLSRMFEASPKDWETYVKMITEEERDHRRFTWAPGLANGLTVSDSVRLFAVQTILKRLNSNKEKAWPKCWEFLWMRRSIFAACAVAYPIRRKLRSMFPESNRILLLSLDYAKLNEDPRYAEGEPALQEVDL